MNKSFFLLLSCIIIHGSINAMLHDEPALHQAARAGDLEAVRASIG